MVRSGLKNVIEPFLRYRVDGCIEDGQYDRACDIAEQYGFDSDYVDERSEALFTKNLGFLHESPARYARDIGLSPEQARDKAIEWVESALKDENLSVMPRDRVVGRYMNAFDVREEELDEADRIQYHFYISHETASDELADAVVEYRDSEAIKKDAGLQDPRFAFADPETVRELVDEQLSSRSFQTEIEEASEEQSVDIYERMDLDWVRTDELDAFIESFWEK